MEITNKKILLTGGAGFLGSFVKKELVRTGVPEESITIPRSAEYDLRIWKNCEKICVGHEVVIHLAAHVGGIGLNKDKPGELMYDNLVMGAHLMEAARQAGVQKFVSVGTVCEYPKFTPIPFKETDLWNGYPEETNAPYGIAKKTLLVQGQAYRRQYGFCAIHLLQINLYGPGDNFDPASSHVVPALIKKVYDAKKENRTSIEVWGTGNAIREFLYVEDAARGIVMATERYDKSEPINLGSGMEISIKNLTETICQLMDYSGEIRWDPSKPDGQPRRQLDVTRAEQEFGFRAKTNFKEGLKKMIAWYQTRERQ